MRRTIATIAITAYAIATLSISAAALTAYDRQELSHVNALADQNPGFESGTVKWSGSPALTINSNAASQFIPGSKQFAVWDSTSSDQEVCSALVKVPESGNCAVSLTYKVPSGTATHKIVAKDGSKDLAIEDVVSSTAAWRHDVEFPCTAAASNQARVCLRSVASNEPAIQLDSGYAGYARTVAQCGVDTPLVSFTPSVSSLSGTLTNYTVAGFWKRNGDTASYKFRILFTGSPGTWSTPTLGLPSGHVIDVNKIPGGNISNYRPFQSSRLADSSVGSYVGLSAAYTTTSVIVQYESAGQAVAVTQVAPFAFVSGDWIDVELSGVPIVGWTASQCVTPEQQRAPKVTNYLSGSGTHTWSNGVTYATIEIIGGGGGGGGAGAASTAGGTGGTTTFDGVNAPGGAGGGGSSVGAGIPGAATAVPCTTNETFMCRGGARGSAGTVTDGSVGSLHTQGGDGAQSRLGGAGLGLYEASGAAAQANTGSGGAGGAADAGAYYAGAGGSAGADITWHRVAPSGSASYTVGAAGAAGTGTRNGGAGGSGYIKVTEHFGYTTAILANSVSSSVANGARMIWASVKSVCSSNPCTIGAQSGDFTSITRSGTGGYQANFNAGTFSGTPVCTCSTVGSLDGHCSAYNSTTSSSTVRTYTPTGSAQDGYIEMMCIGPR